MASKQELRKQVKEAKRLLTDAQKQQQADNAFSIIENLHEFSEAKTILIYHSLPDELPTKQVIEHWSKIKNLLLPRVDGDDLRLFAYDPQKLEYGNYGIVEPQLTNEEWNIKDVDLVIVPAVAFDAQGHRLGRGKGFYDRLLSSSSAIKIGVALDCQMTYCVPNDAHDINMDIVVSNTTLFRK